jgi:hypothetical protein
MFHMVNPSGTRDLIVTTIRRTIRPDATRVSCGEALCAGWARCVNPGAREFSGDAYDSNCIGNNDCFVAKASLGTPMEGKEASSMGRIPVYRVVTRGDTAWKNSVAGQCTCM